MPYVIVRIKFEDFATWKEVFDGAGSMRKEYGSKGVRIFRPVEDANQVVILGEYEDLERARQLFQSQEFREATSRAGVLGPPEVSYLEQVDQLPA